MKCSRSTATSELIKRNPLTARGGERRAGTHRDLEAVLLLQPSFLQRRGRLSQVLDPVDVDGPLAFQVIGQQHVRRPAGQLHQRQPSPHAFHRETQARVEHLDEVPRVRGHIKNSADRIERAADDISVIVIKRS